MAKRGRKPKERKGYFYESEEDAIIQYIKETDEQSTPSERASSSVHTGAMYFCSGICKHFIFFRFSY